jgi:hypothetical protein
MTTNTLNVLAFSDISTDIDTLEGVQHLVAQTLISEIQDIGTSENIRDFLGDVKRLTSVHKDILRTLEFEPHAFALLNGGVTITCTKATLKDSVLALENASIINGAQTQGCIIRYLEECIKKDVIPNVPSVKLEIIVTNDAVLAAKTAIARNTQNNVKSLSIAGRLGYLDALNSEIKIELSDYALKLSESDVGPRFIDSEKLLQVISLLVPNELVISGSGQDKTASYSSKAKVLKDFGTLYKIVNGELEPPKRHSIQRYEVLYDFFIKIAPQAWELYQEWQHKPQWSNFPRNAVDLDSNGIITGVSDGLLFPVIASLSNFVQLVGGYRQVVYPELFADGELISAARSVFVEYNKSDPSAMGRNKQAYSTLYQITHIYALSEQRQVVKVPSPLELKKPRKQLVTAQ